jgi:hypothetical protein
MPQTKILKLKGYNIWLCVRDERNSKHEGKRHCHAIEGDLKNPKASASVCIRNTKKGNWKVGDIFDSTGFSSKMKKIITKSVIFYQETLNAKWEAFNND